MTAEWAGVIVAICVSALGTVLGLVGVVQSRHANRAAKEANELAKQSIDQMKEQSRVNWETDWNAETMTLLIKNTGLDTAYKVSCSISGEGVARSVEGSADCPGNGGEFAVSLPEIGTVREKRGWSEFGTVSGSMSAPTFHSTRMRAKIKVPLKLRINWQTQSGFNRDKELHVIVG
ncbi:MAG: hypothetical protein FWG08_04960 [Propionibacteriaceae bacterium]|nr:hypothetical protein [Propionibacteriaceae bacterium]